MAVLEPGGRYHRRWVDELRAADDHRPLGRAFALQATCDPLLGVLAGGMGICEQLPLLGDLAAQLLKLSRGSGLLGLVPGAWEFALGVLQALHQRLQHAFGAVHPSKMLA